MIRLSIEDGRLMLEATADDLAPRHESQLAFWGFAAGSSENRFVCSMGSGRGLVDKVVSYLASFDLAVDLDESVRTAVAASVDATEVLRAARKYGRAFKEGQHKPKDSQKFLAFLESRVPRRLKEHQRKAALHLIAVGNAANFSVPGSGKTSVVLTVFQWLRETGLIDALFVVGPPACFGPWRTEYKETLGRSPAHAILAGGDIEERRAEYLVNRQSVKDLYLTSFQTLQRDVDHVRRLFEQQDVRFFLVIDEAHYIKRIDGAWAVAVLEVASLADRRCILTGTPFPRSFTDAFNLFDVLWPAVSPITPTDRTRIAVFSEHGHVDEAVEIMNDSVGPLFYRVRKEDLGLAPQQFHEPTLVLMKEHERFVYDSIVGKIQAATQEDYFRDLDAVMHLRRGRMMRLRQCLSYTALLGSAIVDYEEDLLGGPMSVADIVQHYDDLETPGKLDVLSELVRKLWEEGEKVVVWSNFVRTLEKIGSTLRGLGIGVRLIYGATPTYAANVDDEMTREGFIREFLQTDSGIDVLVANPAACAESISLHKACSHAIYYDLSYNCAQYLQSLDRIHRIGGSEETVAHYEFLQYADTIDSDILDNLRQKANRMSRIIDKEYPIYGLDMFTFDEDIEAYERIFRGQRV